MTDTQRAKYQGSKSPEHCNNLSAAAKRRYADPAERERQREISRAAYEKPEVRARYEAAMELVNEKLQSPTYNTTLELALYTLLAEFPEVRKQEWIGYRRVDAYLPEPYNLVFEADGLYWHPDGPDEKRDKYLLSKGVHAVIHLTEHDLDPWLEA